MPGNFKTEGIVLRSIRYGEADRIVHLYTRARGRVGAIAKGSRRPKSRFGGRLEPFFRLDLILYEGRGDLCTVTGASTVDGYGRLRSDGARIGAAARACDAVLRLFDTTEPSPAAYNLLCAYLALLDGENDAGTRREVALAFRAKLMLTAGFSPELAACARCGEAEHLSAFSGAAGGTVCAGCEGEGFALSAEAHEFLVESLGRPLSEAPSRVGEPALRAAERALGETLEHHAHVKLRAAA